MKRRHFLRGLGLAGITVAVSPPRRAFAADPTTTIEGEAALRQDWLARWQKSILGDLANRYCDREIGEELGWLVSPFLNGCYYGYLATGDAAWIERLVDWTDACLKRTVAEPDGFPGWPKGDGGGGASKEFQADSLRGEAMLLRPVVLAAARIRATPTLQSRWGSRADAYIKFAEEIFRKWDSRDCWRAVAAGGLWIVPQFGIDLQTGKWSAGYAQRKTTGFSNPDNKENHIARWLLAMFDATGQAVYRERATAWFQLMKSRIQTRENGKFLVWNYWEPAGPWDYKPDGSPKHWVGVHPNGGYYGIDLEGIVAAFEHGIVFTRADIDRLIATTRDFLWTLEAAHARFQRIDGGPVDERWPKSPGVLWAPLVSYDATLRKIFLANHRPDDWGGIAATPWFLSLGH